MNARYGTNACKLVRSLPRVREGEGGRRGGDGGRERERGNKKISFDASIPKHEGFFDDA